MKKKTPKKSPISEDERWTKHQELVKTGFIIEANKLKNEIINSYKWKKPCHHVGGEIRS